MLALETFDITADGVPDVLVGRDDGLVEVYGFDEMDEPVHRFKQVLGQFTEKTSLSLPKTIIGSTLVQFCPVSLCHATLGEGGIVWQGGRGRERERGEGGGRQNWTRWTPVCADPGFVNESGVLKVKKEAPKFT